MGYSPKREAYRLAEAMGVKIEEFGDSVELEAPRGSVMKASMSHCAVTGRWDLDSAVKMWHGVVRDLKAGVEPCTEADCEYCTDPAWEG